MRPKNSLAAVVSGFVLLFWAATAPACLAQESHIGNVTGHAAAGQKLYRRYCIGCHGPDGDGAGENAPWIDPKPRDFTLAVFKCRSTPTGTLPTDEDLFHAVSRGFVTTNMPQWLPLTRQNRADLVAYIKTFSPKWKTLKPGTPITIPPEPPLTIESMLRGRQLYQKMECWKCHGAKGHADGPSSATLTDNKDLPIRAYDFATGSRFMCGVTNQDLYKIFMTGLDGSPMPSFADDIQPAQAWDLVHFLRTMQPLKTPEAALWQAWLAVHAGDLTPIGPGGVVNEPPGRSALARSPRMRTHSIVVTVAALLGLGVLARSDVVGAAASAGTVSGKVTYTGTPPKMKPIDMAKEPSCAEQHATSPVMTENVVTGPGNALRWVAVYVSAGDQGAGTPTEAVRLDQKGCQYIPHVLVLQPNQPLDIYNDDKTSHNIHPLAKVNSEWNKSQPIGAPPIHTKWEKPEFIPVKCNVHPWMHSWQLVLTTPRYAVTGEDGGFSLQGLPPGKYTVTAWHEQFGTETQDVTISGTETKTVNFVFKATPY